MRVIFFTLSILFSIPAALANGDLASQNALRLRRFLNGSGDLYNKVLKDPATKYAFAQAIGTFDSKTNAPIPPKPNEIIEVLLREENTSALQRLLTSFTHFKAQSSCETKAAMGSLQKQVAQEFFDAMKAVNGILLLNPDSGIEKKHQAFIAKHKLTWSFDEFINRALRIFSMYMTAHTYTEASIPLKFGTIGPDGSVKHITGLESDPNVEASADQEGAEEPKTSFTEENLLEETYDSEDARLKESKAVHVPLFRIRLLRQYLRLGHIEDITEALGIGYHLLENYYSRMLPHGAEYAFFQGSVRGQIDMEEPWLDQIQMTSNFGPGVASRFKEYIKIYPDKNLNLFFTEAFNFIVSFAEITSHGKNLCLVRSGAKTLINVRDLLKSIHKTWQMKQKLLEFDAKIPVSHSESEDHWDEIRSAFLVGVFEGNEKALNEALALVGDNLGLPKDFSSIVRDHGLALLVAVEKYKKQGFSLVQTRNLK